MSFIELNAGPWRGVAFLRGLAGPEDTPAGYKSLAWRHDGTARLGGVLERAQAQVLIDAEAVPDKVQRAQPDAFDLRSVTTQPAGEAFVFVGHMFNRTGAVETKRTCMAAQLTIAPETELAITVEEGFEYAVLAADGDLAVNNTAVPARSAGLLDAGHRTLGLKNRSESIAHVLVLGGKPA